MSMVKMSNERNFTFSMCHVNVRAFGFDLRGRQDCGTMCTNVTSAGNGVVQSRNFPGDYGNEDRECKITIVVPAGKRIQLTFTTFNLETGKGSIKVSKASIHIEFISSFQYKVHFN
jgi:hypothetical protein